MGQAGRADDDQAVIRQDKCQLRDIVLVLDERFLVLVDPRRLVTDRGCRFDFVDRRNDMMTYLVA